MELCNYDIMVCIIHYCYSVNYQCELKFFLHFVIVPSALIMLTASAKLINMLLIWFYTESFFLAKSMANTLS